MEKKFVEHSDQASNRLQTATATNPTVQDYLAKASFNLTEFLILASLSKVSDQESS